MRGRVGLLGGIRLLHSFNESLAKSHEQSDAPWWEEVYKQAFPLASMACVRSDGWAQRGGIDRVLTLKSGKTLTVDEKVRYEEYNDILLERWSDEAKQIPGWIQKDLACDYIAYAFVQSQRCYLLPFQDLRRAWRRHGRRWILDCREVRAQNKGYVTVSVAVPIDELMLALTDAMLVSWKKNDWVAQYEAADRERQAV